MCHRGHLPFFLYPLILHPLERESSFQGRSNGVFSQSDQGSYNHGSETPRQEIGVYFLLPKPPPPPTPCHGLQTIYPRDYSAPLNTWAHIDTPKLLVGLKWKAGMYDDSDDGGIVWSCDVGASAFLFLKSRKLCRAERKNWLFLAMIGGIERNHSPFLLERNILTNDTEVSPSFLGWGWALRKNKRQWTPRGCLKVCTSVGKPLLQSKVPYIIHQAGGPVGTSPWILLSTIFTNLDQWKP